MRKISYVISIKKIIVLTAVLLFFFSTIGYALDVTLDWDANTPPDLDHYVVFWGTSSGSYTSNSGNIDKSQTTYTTTGLSDATTYYFPIKPYDHQGRESDYSNELDTLIPPSIPTGFRIVDIQ